MIKNVSFCLKKKICFFEECCLCGESAPLFNGAKISQLNVQNERRAISIFLHSMHGLHGCCERMGIRPAYAVPFVHALTSLEAEDDFLLDRNNRRNSIMKKTSALIASLVCAFALAAGGSFSSKQPAAEAPQETTQPSAQPAAVDPSGGAAQQ